MKNLFSLVLFLIIPLICNAQFEQKLSINISSGVFKTFGKKYVKSTLDAYQMPNYKLGVSQNIGVQFNINRRLSLLADVGFLFSGKWAYEDYLHYTINDPVNAGEYIAEGFNTLNLSNLSLGVKPKYFLKPGEKWNPYLSFGLYLNFTNAAFSDNFWYAGKDLVDQDKLPASWLTEYPSPYNPFLEKNIGIGFNPGAGLEYNVNDKFGFSVSAGYDFFFINKEKIKGERIKENFSSLILQTGVRFNFLKSKKL